VIYELRIYTVHAGRMEALQKRFRDHTCRLFDKHGIRSIGYWTNVIGGPNDELWYMVEFDSLAARETAWVGFLQDPEWIRANQASTADGPIVVHFENRIMKPTDFSALGQVPFACVTAATFN
jgi:hypothetical protein